MNQADNVATATSTLTKGDVITLGDRTVEIIEEIPFGHKIALQPLSIGDDIVKYGLQIGSSVDNIDTGGHVHIHNVESNYGRGDR
ncbi:UxaA family hydrolase [Natronosalvus rutilus]|uniref:UxaA family hydrolase n=1 Tax=Natronosalvus rutilus TaxID=2953753 RepID=A0A9E7NCA2_9EURY|nr:UxaA family hydrolase [Natronosalvus rutilus]UTF54811.1 UxaA family hydrolase [Natronosalvus rutilus]